SATGDPVYPPLTIETRRERSPKLRRLRRKKVTASCSATTSSRRPSKRRRATDSSPLCVSKASSRRTGTRTTARSSTLAADGGRLRAALAAVSLAGGTRRADGPDPLSANGADSRGG